jgi:hypothetical protein
MTWMRSLSLGISFCTASLPMTTTLTTGPQWNLWLTKSCTCSNKGSLPPQSSLTSAITTFYTIINPLIPPKEPFTMAISTTSGLIKSQPTFKTIPLSWNLSDKAATTGGTSLTNSLYSQLTRSLWTTAMRPVIKRRRLNNSSGWRNS